MQPNQLVDSTLEALADSYDQIVFLERAVQRAVRATRLSDLPALVQDAAGAIGAGGSALKLGDVWLAEVPAWLRQQSQPEKRTFQLENAEGGGPAHVLGVPYENGWVAFWDKPTPFTAGDARLAETLGNLLSSTAQAITARAERVRAEVAEHDRRTAARIWRNVVPQALRMPPGYHVASTLRPAHDVGGDFLVRQRDWLAIGDVSGKGVPAAMFSGMFVTAFALAAEYDDVGAALARGLHSYLENAEMFATVAAVKLNPDGRVPYLNLGHPPILVRRANGEVEALAASAPPLGTFALPAYPPGVCTLQPGEMLCLYTDGLSEAERGAGPDAPPELFGMDRIGRLLAEHATPEAMLRATLAQSEAWQVTDDFTVSLVQFAPGNA